MGLRGQKPHNNISPANCTGGSGSAGQPPASSSSSTTAQLAGISPSQQNQSRDCSPAVKQRQDSGQQQQQAMSNGSQRKTYKDMASSRMSSLGPARAPALSSSVKQGPQPPVTDAYPPLPSQAAELSQRDPGDTPSAPPGFSSKCGPSAQPKAAAAASVPAAKAESGQAAAPAKDADASAKRSTAILAAEQPAASASCERKLTDATYAAAPAGTASSSNGPRVAYPGRIERSSGDKGRFREPASRNVITAEVRGGLWVPKAHSYPPPPPPQQQQGVACTAPSNSTEYWAVKGGSSSTAPGQPGTQTSPVVAAEVGGPKHYPASNGNVANAATEVATAAPMSTADKSASATPSSSALPPPAPSAALAAKASAPAAQQQQQQHIQLPSSQAVNMAAVTARNNSWGGSDGSDSGYNTDSFRGDAAHAAATGYVTATQPGEEIKVAEQESCSKQLQPLADTTASQPASAATSNGPVQQANGGAAGTPTPLTTATGPAADAKAMYNTNRPADIAAGLSRSPAATYQPIHGLQQDTKHNYQPPVMAATAHKGAFAPGNKRHLSADAPPFVLPGRGGSMQQPAGGSVSGGGSSSSGPASTGSVSAAGSGMLSSSALEQRWLGTAAEGDPRPATADSTLTPKQGSGVSDSSSSSKPSSRLLFELAERLQQEERQQQQQQAEAASKAWQLQQQVDAERAARAAVDEQKARLTSDLTAAYRTAQELEQKLSSQAGRVDALERELAASRAGQEDATAEAAAASHNAIVMRHRLSQLEEENSRLADNLRQWKDSYDKTEADNRMLRMLLGPAAPAPGTGGSGQVAAAAAAPASAHETFGNGNVRSHVGSSSSSGGSSIAAQPAVRGPAVKQPPPGFGPLPQRANMQAAASVVNQQQQAQQLAALAPTVDVLPAAVKPDVAAEQQQHHHHLKNEHEVVRTLLSMLPAGPDQSMAWTDAEDAAVDAMLVPLSWNNNYFALYGPIPRFMMERPVVFGQCADGSFFKWPDAEQKVAHAAAMEAAAAAAQEIRARQVSGDGSVGSASGNSLPGQQQLPGVLSWCSLPPPSGSLADGSNGGGYPLSDQQHLHGTVDGWSQPGLPGSGAFLPGRFASLPMMALPLSLSMQQGSMPFIPPLTGGSVPLLPGMFPASLPMVPPSMPVSGHGVHQHADAGW